VSEIDFIIGHELGHIGAGHLSWNTFLLPAMLMPWLGPAYSRAREYTCDACGYAVVENLTVASRALALLAAGGRNAGRMNLDAFVEQRREAAGFWMSVYELNSTHPFLSKRVAALRNRLQPGTAKAEPRGVMAYLTAPMWGIYAPGGGGPMIAIFMILGIVFALGAARGMSKFPGFSQFAAANARAHAVQPDAEEAVGEDGVEGSDGEESESDTQEPARR
jgi:hypothetical protein